MGYSEETGFFIAENQVPTNFHVIADEPSPKVIFSDGFFITPTKILCNPKADMAVLYTKEKCPQKVFSLPEDIVKLYEDELLMVVGYLLEISFKG